MRSTVSSENHRKKHVSVALRELVAPRDLATSAAIAKPSQNPHLQMTLERNAWSHRAIAWVARPVIANFHDDLSFL
jgi:hypothetical protein